jgi:hypothetical protein
MRETKRELVVEFTTLFVSKELVERTSCARQRHGMKSAFLLFMDGGDIVLSA